MLLSPRPNSNNRTKNIICKYSELSALQYTNTQLDILQLIINPFHYASSDYLEILVKLIFILLCRGQL